MESQYQNKIGQRNDTNNWLKGIIIRIPFELANQIMSKNTQCFDYIGHSISWRVLTERLIQYKQTNDSIPR